MFECGDLASDCDSFPPKEISAPLFDGCNQQSPDINISFNVQEEQDSIPVLFSGRSYPRRISLKENTSVSLHSGHDEFRDKREIAHAVLACSDVDVEGTNQGEGIAGRISNDWTVETELNKTLSTDWSGTDTVADPKDSLQFDSLTLYQNLDVTNLLKDIEEYYEDRDSVVEKNKTTKREGSASHTEIDAKTSQSKDERVWYGCQKCHLEFSTTKGLANHIKTHPKVMIGKNTCVYCGKRLDDIENLTDHLNAEHLFDITNYTCESCHVECVNADLFDKHQYSCHRREDTKCLMCSNCDKVYYDNNILLYHRQQQRQCHICNLNFCMSSDQFKTHKDKHVLFKYRCSRCNNAFITKASLTKHLNLKGSCVSIVCDKHEVPSGESGISYDKSSNDYRSETEEETSKGHTSIVCEDDTNADKKEKTIRKCPLCSLEFVLMKNLWRHLSVVHSKDVQDTSFQHLPAVKGHQCTICKKTFTKRSTLSSHMASHIRKNQDNSRPQCSICGKSFRKQRYLVDHMRLHTGRSAHQCHSCDKKFLRRDHLKLHMEIHNNGHKSYKCPYCHKSYMRKRDQLQHVRLKHVQPSTTTQEKPKFKEGEEFPCLTCDKQFPTTLKLWTHELDHKVGNPPYKCGECTQEFPSLNSLKRHYLIHWNLKPFVCSVCSRSFRYNQSLKRHMVTHTGEKSFTCQQCGKSFGLKGTLNTHMQQHAAPETLTCSNCDKSFRSKRQLKLHHCYQTQHEFGDNGSDASCSLLREASVCMSYDTTPDITMQKPEKLATNDSLTTLISEDVIDSITQVTHLISETSLPSVTQLVPSNITADTITPISHYVLKVSREIVSLASSIPESSALS